VGPRQHRRGGEWSCQRLEPADERAQRRRKHAVAAVAEHQRVGEVVDVLGGAGEVEERPDAVELGIAGEPLGDEVLDRLHVVVGRALDGLDAARGLQGHVFGEVVEDPAHDRREGRQLRDARVAREELHPADLGPDPEADQAVLAEDVPQRVELGGVAPVEGRDGGERVAVHARPWKTPYTSRPASYTRRHGHPGPGWPRPTPPRAAPPVFLQHPRQ
jgi:hypothetical protein